MQRRSDACVFCLTEKGRVVMTMVVEVDDIFAVGQKAWCNQFGIDLNKMVLVKDFGVTRWMVSREGIWDGSVDDFPADVC